MNAAIARAESCRRAGDRAGALAELRGALAITPDDLELQIALGALLAATGEPTAAIEVLERTLRRLPVDKHARILAVIGVAHDELGHKAEAIAASRQAIALDGAGPRVGPVLTLARLLAETGELDEALALFRDLLERVTPEVRVNVERAIAEIEAWQAADATPPSA